MDRVTHIEATPADIVDDSYKSAQEILYTTAFSTLTYLYPAEPAFKGTREHDYCNVKILGSSYLRAHVRICGNIRDTQIFVP